MEPATPPSLGFWGQQQQQQPLGLDVVVGAANASRKPPTSPLSTANASHTLLPPLLPPPMARQPSRNNATQAPPLPNDAAASTTTTADADDAWLFATPPDLVCPITLQLLHDPVINAAGQVYERAAIERALAAPGNAPADPLSGAPLASAALLPVWPMRSRAAEYREAAARGCVAAALDARRSTHDPVRYLRRAAELLHPPEPPPSAASADAPPPPPPPPSVPGISPGLARLLLAGSTTTTPPGGGGALALKFFAEELRRAGRAEDAADVFYRLLLGAQERRLQQEYLGLCLDCWGCSCVGGDGGGGACAGDGVEGDSGPSSAPPPSVDIVAKLADFVERRAAGLSAGAVLDALAGSGRLGAGELLRLCDELLARYGADAAAATADDGGAGGGGFSKARWQADQGDVLVRYVRLSCGAAGERADALVQRVLAAKDDGAAAAAAAAVAEAPRDPQQQRRRQRRGGGAKAALRVAAAGVLAVASLLRGEHPLVRLARTAPLLFLLQQQGGGGGGGSDA